MADTLRAVPLAVADDEVKSCCAVLYESDWAKLLLGDSFHPGGVALSKRLGEVVGLGPQTRLLDVAAGKGTSAIALAKQFGCEVVGVDFGAGNVRDAQAAAEKAGVAGRVHFEQGDAEALRFDAASFDAIICECAFCTFPNKAVAASEFARVLRPGGRVGLSDLTRSGAVPKELEGLLSWIACIADAQPIGTYMQFMEGAGLQRGIVEPHDEALGDLVGGIRTKLLGAEIMVKLKKLTLPSNIDFDEAKRLARSAADAVKQGKLGYAIITAAKAG